MPIASAVSNHVFDRPTPSWTVRTSAPFGHLILPPMRTPMTEWASSNFMRPFSWIQHTVSYDSSIRIVASSGSLRPLVTRIEIRAKIFLGIGLAARVKARIFFLGVRHEAVELLDVVEVVPKDRRR